MPLTITENTPPPTLTTYTPTTLLSDLAALLVHAYTFTSTRVYTHALALQSRLQRPPQTSVSDFRLKLLPHAHTTLCIRVYKSGIICTFCSPETHTMTPSKCVACGRAADVAPPHLWRQSICNQSTINMQSCVAARQASLRCTPLTKLELGHNEPVHGDVAAEAMAASRLHLADRQRARFLALPL